MRGFCSCIDAPMVANLRHSCQSIHIRSFVKILRFHEIELDSGTGIERVTLEVPAVFAIFWWRIKLNSMSNRISFV